MFVGRTSELADLRKEFDADKASLLIIYGRRRVGKSRLLQEAAAGRRLVYLQATRETSPLNLEAFKRAIVGTFGEDPTLAGLADWLGVFHYLAKAAERSPRLIVVIDEFSYLCDADPVLPSVVQKFWDSGAPKAGRLKIALCGSVTSSMEGLLAERNPLYGRQTGIFDIRPLPLRDAVAFLPKWRARDQLTAYAIFGGIPYYLEACDPQATLRDNVINLLLSRSGRLFEEPTNMLQAELREVRVYASVLRAIADGCRESGEIKNRVLGAKSGISISPYLDRLQAMRIVRAVRSLDAEPKSRNLRFVIDDRLVAFWNRFVRPNAESISFGFGAEVWRLEVEPGLSEFMGQAFEEVCRDHLRRHAQEFLPAPAQEVGQVWSDNFDIDVAGRLLDGTRVYGECKWSRKRVGADVLERLVERAGLTRYGSGDASRHFLLYSLTGFTGEVSERVTKESTIRLLTIEDLMKPPKRRPRRARTGARAARPYRTPA